MDTKNYDAVVIGAGIGGLSAGALLSHWGYRVLVAEKQDHIGGRWATFDEDGFKLPAGALAIHYFGTDLQAVYNEVGKEANFVSVPTLYYRIGGVDHLMPTKGSLSAGLDIINKLENDKVKVTSGFAKAMGKETILGAFRKGTKEYRPGQDMTFKDWLLQYTSSEGTHAIFDTITNTLCGGHSYEISSNAVFGFFVKMGGSRDVAIAPNGNMENAEMLAEVIRGNGELMTNAEVKQIKVNKGKAISVILQQEGKEIEAIAQVVISDAGPLATTDLAGNNCFGEEYLKELRFKMRAHPVTMCYVASDEPLWPDDGQAAILMLVGARRITSVIPLSSISAQYAPAGQHLMFCFGSPQTSEAHLDPKIEQAQILADLKDNFPKFKDHGRVLKMISKDISDPMPEVRARVGLGMPVETPVKNLFNIGDGCPAFGMGGSNAAVENARRVAEKIRKDYKPL
jgi:phytoene dehydrogenase-like protein